MKEEKAQHERVWELLAPREPERLYALVDAGRHSHIHAHLEAWKPPHIQLEPEGVQLPAEAAPWLVWLQAGNTFSDWLLQEGLFAGWCLLLRSRLTLVALAAHLTPWLLAWQPEHQQRLLVRYYDPVVIHGWLMHLSADDRMAFFQALSGLWRPIGEGQLEGLRPQGAGLEREPLDCRPADDTDTPAVDEEELNDDAVA